MGGLSIWHWLVVGILVLLLFGKGRFSDMMGDVAKGIKSFKKGMAEDEAEANAPKKIGESSAAPTPSAAAEPVKEADKQD
ncbi:Sec-independent protein translocase TatA [Sphingorhabdus lutea]|uniref:Sec-independent protein translocase protein TatA n=1 Tax=Sphingorhabdus lutea TaxID=1913578 RepID=A0A1L3JF61_9SPHN|nr:twin-arginine translocase TatA/TatE family subunit [Sphingorhabdus lutea]APG63754.1 Sec-independent protein translocase TatA [Sphingorhabdus lutea]